MNLPDPVTLVALILAFGVAPFVALMVTSYTKLVIVFGLLRTALGLQQTPPNMVLNGIAIVLTIYIMAPVGMAVGDALRGRPLGVEGQGLQDLMTVIDAGKTPVKEFLQKHTQFPGPGRTNTNVVGFPVMPVYAAKAGGFFFIVFGVIALIAALVQINPIWGYGPYDPSPVTAGSQPDWYMGFADGALRLLPGWLEFNFWGFTLSLNIALGALVHEEVHVNAVLERAQALEYIARPADFLLAGVLTRQPYPVHVDIECRAAVRIGGVVLAHAGGDVRAELPDLRAPPGIHGSHR